MSTYGGPDVCAVNMTVNWDTPFVSVVVPCRNEIDHVRQFVESFRRQDYPANRIEILIADGRSDDGTLEVLTSLAEDDCRMIIVDNPGRCVSSGLNEAIRSARGDVIVRMDVHTMYAQDYVSSCVRVLGSSGADCVGGPWKAVGTNYLEKAIAAGFRSNFGSGGARSHVDAFEGEVDSVYLGCWRRDTLVQYGMFDEDLVRNQDDELCLRIRKAGGRVWQSPGIRSEYRPRGSLARLWRQYYQYGYWKVRVIQKHRQLAALRHVVPAMAVLVGVALAAASLMVPVARWLLLALVISYLGAAIFSALRSVAGVGDWKCLPALPIVFAVYHLSYGIGFLRGVVDFQIFGRGPAEHASQLSR